MDLEQCYELRTILQQWWLHPSRRFPYCTEKGGVLYCPTQKPLVGRGDLLPDQVSAHPIGC